MGCHQYCNNIWWIKANNIGIKFPDTSWTISTLASECQTTPSVPVGRCLTSTTCYKGQLYQTIQPYYQQQKLDDCNNRTSQHSFAKRWSADYVLGRIRGYRNIACNPMVFRLFSSLASNSFDSNYCSIGSGGNFDLRIHYSFCFRITKIN